MKNILPVFCCTLTYRQSQAGQLATTIFLVVPASTCNCKPAKATFMCMLLMLVPSARAWGTAAWNNPEQLGTEFSFQNGLMPSQGLARPLHDPAQLIDMMRVQQEMLRVPQEMLRSVQEMLTSQEKSHVAFRDCVLHNQADLLAQVNSLRQQLGNKSLVKVVYLPDDCPSLPVNSLDDLRALNVYLEARDKLQHMVDYYSQKGGTDKNADTRALLTCLVHNDVAARCSWKGSKGRKEPLMN
ncbi:uncharacterized protein LOC120845843 [Ixodes scapularis]|uniref:uncharacterized protein LOC120845843 n=1 Tax=Ixodes scapularis TaxID=6945 RepID=UPI001A9EAF53|nr:uncharacterized protein LOC120845843 [Ixodes scapularis]